MKNVLNNAANLLANPGLQLFNILQSQRTLFVLNITIGRSLLLPNLETVEAMKYSQTWR
jgi:hypothetical protein